MLHTARTALAVGLLCLAPSAAHAARPKPTGFDPARAAAVSALPVRVVVLNDRLRSQWAYGAYSLSADFAAQAAVNNVVSNAIASGMSSGAAIGAGALGGAIAGAIIDANMRAQARGQVERADALLAGRGCRLDLAVPLADAVDRAIRASSWGMATSPRRDVVAPGQKTGDLLADTPERQQFTVTYSMTPDYEYLVTSINVATYAAALKPEKARRDDPAWVDELVIVSDPMTLAEKTPADVEAAVAAELERHRATGMAALVKAANSGDREARKQAVKLTDEHRRNMKEAKAAQWTPGEAAARRAAMWAADACAPLRAAADAQVAEAEALLGRLFRGELPARVSEPGRVLDYTFAGDEGARVVEARPVGLYASGRAGTTPRLGFRYSWLPVESE